MDEFHKTLERQIKKYIREHQVEISPEWEPLLREVSATYRHFDEDRALMERSLDISSRELLEINAKIEEKVRMRTRELQEVHARLIASMSSVPLGMLIIDRDGNILFRNDMVAIILDVSKDCVFAQVVDRFPESIKIAKKIAACVDEGRVIEENEIQIGKKIVRVLLAPIVNQSNHATTLGHVFLIEDVTEANALERGKEEFFSIASHELRTPLTAIRWNTSMLLEYFSDKITDVDVLQMIQDMMSASERLIKIVNDFLDVSRLEQKRGGITKEIFDICSIVWEEVRELSDIAAKKGITIELAQPETPLAVNADRDRTKQVLVNLLGNAINFTKHGGVKIRVEKMDRVVKIYVSDTGVGISPKNQNLLFRKFQQAGENMLARDVTQSTGLGLYISKMIMEEIGGAISLEESTLGKGSTFSFTLPLASA